MNALDIRHLTKTYLGFQLQDVSFSLHEGKIMGLIGRNGAGKTTTLKSILNLVHPDKGEITFFGMNLKEKEKEIKQMTGYAAGGTSYYQRKKLKDIVKITKTFYPGWDERAYREYMERFSLDENKKLIELSEGMKVKFHLTLALSHHARLLILDEPTSGLDPVSRDDFLEILLRLADEGITILFSTHIITDLDKCADDITYIHGGRILATEAVDEFIESYRLLEFSKELTGELSKEQKKAVIGTSRKREKTTALIRTEDSQVFAGMTLMKTDLETIMIHLEREGA